LRWCWHGITPDGAFGWLGLRGGVKGAQRKLHIAEIVIGSPGVLFARLTVAWHYSQAG